MKEQQQEAKAPLTETIFRYMTYVCIVVIALCVPGFKAFRDYCLQKHYHVFSLTSTWVVFLGFFSYGLVKYLYYSKSRTLFLGLVKSKYQNEERERKADLLQKLSFDSIFYACISLYCYFAFRQEYWFPQSAGGEGSCNLIYRDYPDWPASRRSEMEAYFCFQLGVHVFSLVELIFARTNDRKYYEWMLHHTVAVTLIFFSLLCNEIIIGIMILVVHDFSDVFLSSARFFAEAQLPFFIKNKVTEGYMAAQLFFTWIYFRLTLYPFCLISAIYNNVPTPSQQWYSIYWQFIVLFVFTIILAIMHAYWLIFLVKSIYAMTQKSETVNLFDNHKKN